ncbi:hypothetical protein, partial [Streptococcus suis]
KHQAFKTLFRDITSKIPISDNLLKILTMWLGFFACKNTLGISKSVLSNGVKQFVIFISSSGVKRSGRPFQPIAKKHESDWNILVKIILVSSSCLFHRRK